MPSSSHPHMIFATEAADLTQERLVELLEQATPGGEAERSAIKVAWVRDGYAWTFWFEDADRVGEMYADYLPEGARRRPLVNATTVIDMSGALDPEDAHAAEATTIVTHLAGQDGVNVFSEATKRFVGMSYGDEPEAPVETDTSHDTKPTTASPAPEVATPMTQTDLAAAQAGTPTAPTAG